jgi:60 kDa SS-A/Ro ribonucleoprotein
LSHYGDAFVRVYVEDTRARRRRRHRHASGIDARLVVVGMVSNGFSIADPADQGMLDVVGFDTATPQLISDFARGAL